MEKAREAIHAAITPPRVYPGGLFLFYLLLSGATFGYFIWRQEWGIVIASMFFSFFLMEHISLRAYMVREAPAIQGIQEEISAGIDLLEQRKRELEADYTRAADDCLKTWGEQMTAYVGDKIREGKIASPEDLEHYVAQAFMHHFGIGYLNIMVNPGEPAEAPITAPEPPGDKNPQGEV